MTYVTPNFADVTESMVADCQETSINTLRHTTQGTDKVLLKYTGADPSWVTSLGLTKYTYAEIIAELKTEDWALDPNDAIS